MLGNAELRRVQNLPREPCAVTPTAEFLYEFIQEATMLPDRQAFDVLENKIRSLQFGHDTDEFANQAIPLVIQCPVTDHGEPLARSAAKNDIHTPTAYSCSPPNLVPSETDHRSGQDGATRKIICVNSAVNGVDFHGSHDVEASLLEAQTKASSTRKQIDPDWPWHQYPPAFNYELIRF
jgi:hypothetical protein